MSYAHIYEEVGILVFKTCCIALVCLKGQLWLGNEAVRGIACSRYLAGLPASHHASTNPYFGDRGKQKLLLHFCQCLMLVGQPSLGNTFLSSSLKKRYRYIKHH